MGGLEDEPPRACLTIHVGAGPAQITAGGVAMLQDPQSGARRRLASAHLDDAGIHQQSSDTP